MVVAVEPMLCTPVQPGKLSFSPPCRSGISASICGGRTAAAAISNENAFRSTILLRRTCGLRPKSWPGSPCDCTLVGRKEASNAITFQVWPIQNVTTSVSTCRRPCRRRGVGLVKNADSVPASEVAEPARVAGVAGLIGELPTKSISKSPLTRTPSTAGAAKRNPSRVPRELYTVRPLSPANVPFRLSVGCPP